MKKNNSFFYILLACTFLLTGCNRRIYSNETESAKDSFTTTPTTVDLQPIETTSFETASNEPTTPPPTPYELLLEKAPINNACNVYKIGSDISISEGSDVLAFFEWGDGAVLAISGYSAEDIQVFYIDPISHEIFAQMAINSYIFSVKFYAGANNTLIVADLPNDCILVYDKNFSLINKFHTPDSVSFSDFPLISGDDRYAYYSDRSGTKFYRMALDTGISETVISFGPENVTRTPTSIISDNTREILVVSTYDFAVFETTYEYYDINTFELIQTNNLRADFEPCKGYSYGCRIYDTVARLAYLSELDSKTAVEIFPESSDEYYSYWFTTDNLLFTSINIDADGGDALYNHIRLRAYNLDNGLCAYETTILFDDSISYGGYVSQLFYSPKYNAVLGVFVNDNYHFFLWDLGADSSHCLDETIYTDKYYASDEINWEGIAALKASANELSIKYGVNICIADDTRTDTGDYNVAQVFHTTIIRNALTILEEALESYPRDFFYQLQSEDGVPLEINLSGTISPNAGYDSISTAIGLHNYNAGKQYVILDINNTYSLKTTIYHEIFHAIDRIVVYNSILFDSDWHSLNPEDFEYDYGYGYNVDNNDSTYLYYTEEGYFIDIYSKSFPNEDRARIVENAMSGNTYFFESEGLYRKLSYICQALREVFDSSTWGETTCWEAALLPMKDYYGETLPEELPETNY